MNVKGMACSHKSPEGTQVEANEASAKEDVSNTAEKNKNELLFCRLCSGTSQKCANQQWKTISDIIIESTGSVKWIIEKHLPKWLIELLSPLHDQHYVCARCVSSLKLLSEFVQRIVHGQEQLKSKTEFQQNEQTLKRRKRGRPRKDGNPAIATSKTKDSNILLEDRVKRKTRVPRRFECDLLSDDKQLGNDDNPSNTVVPTGGVSNDLEQNTETNPSDQSEDKSDGTYTPKNGNRLAKRKRGRPKKPLLMRYKCDQCLKSYSSQTSLIYHRVSHRESNDYTCDICKKSFAHKSLLTNHFFTHTWVKPFLCDDENCEASFKTRASLFNHKRAVHGKNKKTWICDQCEGHFTSAPSLQSHLKIHRGEKPYLCKYCDKSFRKGSNLKEHERTHTQEKPYCCDEGSCSKKFTTLSQLRAHKQHMHIESTRYLCGVCGKSFTQRNGFTAHMRHHKGVKLTCPTCNKGFTDYSSLRKHKFIHSAQKPFRCDQCGKSFSDPSNFKRHKKIHDRANRGQNCPSSVKNEDSECLPSNTVDGYPNAISDTAFENVSIHTPAIVNAVETVSQVGDTSNATSESFVHILRQEELDALVTGTASTDGNIIFLYQPDDIFAVEANDNVSPADGDGTTTVVLQEVLHIEEDMSSLS